MTKGKRRERQASELYEQAGYETFRPQESKWGETDMFGLFDILAIPGRHEDRTAIHPRETSVRLAQVKSNRASGIEQWCRDVTGLLGGPVKADFLVCHDREGWRLLCPYSDKMHKKPVPIDSIEPYILVDERELDCNMGEGIIEYLRRDE